MIEDIKTQHHFSSGVYARRMELPAGWFAESHKHKFDHMSILASGEVNIFVDDEKFEYTTGAIVTIEAGKVHKIVAKTDSIWFCIHASDEMPIDKIEQILIEES